MEIIDDYKKLRNRQKDDPDLTKLIKNKKEEFRADLKKKRAKKLQNEFNEKRRKLLTKSIKAKRTDFFKRTK